MSFSIDHLLKTTPALIGTASVDGHFVRLSHAWETFLGRPLEELEGARFLDFVHPDDQDATREQMARMDANKSVEGFVNRYRTTDRGYRELSWRSRRGPDGLIYFTAEDITDSAALQSSLEASNERLRQVAEIASIGGWELDLATNTLSWDEVTRRIHEVPEDFVPTVETAVAFYEGDAADTIAEAVSTAVENNRDWDLVLPLRTYSGNRIYVRASGRPVAVDGVTVKLTGTFQDVTEQQEYAEMLEAGRAAAESANAAKSRFLANMSHEIRTPLNGVLGMAQLLQRTELSDQQDFYLRTLHDSGQALMSLIDGVLDIARIESGEVELADRPFDLFEQIHTARSAVAAQAAEKSLMLTLQLSKTLPRFIQGDSARLKQVLINLLGNAVKFTDQGAVILAAECGPDDDIRFTVEDTGPGVAEEHKDAIFERFTQVDSSSTRAKDGAGLGLSISRELIHLAGGEIGVEDSASGGARFWFTWPCGAVIASDAAPARSSTASHAAPGALTVLVVEDNPVNAMMVEEVLKSEGHHVLRAADGQAALDMAERHGPDVILMDIHMPEMNGIEAIKRLRALPQPLSNTRVFVLTADVTDDTRRQLADLRIDKSFSKPIDINQLIMALNSGKAA